MPETVPAVIRPAVTGPAVTGPAVTGRAVLGADACPAGWVGIVLSNDSVHAIVRPDIAALVSAAMAEGTLTAIGIDIPIGLADASMRQADIQARKAAGPRWASVFATPVRRALMEPDYRRASGLNRRLTGNGISRQAFGLRAKILDVDRWLPGAPCPVAEVHPELSFALMSGDQPLADSKTTWAGAARRRELLAAHGIELAGDLGLSGLRTGVDDVLDAAAVAWTARRIAAGQARRLPETPERFSDGIDCAIWT